MDRQSVAQMLGTCFAEFVRERVEDHGGYVTEDKLIRQVSRQYRVPPEYAERMIGYAARIGAVEVRELADGSVTVSNVSGYGESTSPVDLSCAAAAIAEDRTDYPVSYGSTDTRPATPAVMFPEATRDTVTAGEAEAAPKTSRKGTDQCEQWYREHLGRRDENARIIAESPAPDRKDYTADPLGEHRAWVEDQSLANRYYTTRHHRQQHGCIGCEQAVARDDWPEADRIINWLDSMPGRMQEIKALYYERGAHSPAQQDRLRKTINKLMKQGKIRSTRRKGKRVAVLASWVKPRQYRIEDYGKVRGEDTAEESHDDTSPEQTFDPAVINEMTAAGASYREAWDG